MAFAFWAFLAVVVVIQAAPVVERQAASVVEEEPWNAEVNFGPEENFRAKSRRTTGNHLFNPRLVAPYLTTARQSRPTFYSLDEIKFI